MAAFISCFSAPPPPPGCWILYCHVTGPIIQLYGHTGPPVKRETCLKTSPSHKSRIVAINISDWRRLMEYDYSVVTKFCLWIKTKVYNGCQRLYESPSCTLLVDVLGGEFWGVTSLKGWYMHPNRTSSTFSTLRQECNPVGCVPAVH